MISYIKGTLVHVDPTRVVIEAAGLGYEVNIPLSTYEKVKDLKECLLHTHLQIKEDAHTLYGFFNQNEKLIFTTLISISGVGPATGLMVLGTLSPAEVRQAIIEEDVNRIKAVKGIGAKTAQRIILELRDKLAKAEIEHIGEPGAPATHNTLRQEALTALTTLGIGKGVAEKTVDTILRTNGPDITLEELIKKALKSA